MALIQLQVQAVSPFGDLLWNSGEGFRCYVYVEGSPACATRMGRDRSAGRPVYLGISRHVNTTKRLGAGQGY